MLIALYNTLHDTAIIRAVDKQSQGTRGTHALHVIPI